MVGWRAAVDVASLKEERGLQRNLKGVVVRRALPPGDEGNGWWRSAEKLPSANGGATGLSPATAFWSISSFPFGLREKTHRRTFTDLGLLYRMA